MLGVQPVPVLQGRIQLLGDGVQRRFNRLDTHALAFNLDRTTLALANDVIVKLTSSDMPAVGA